MLVHINKRIKTNGNVQLPVESLTAIYSVRTNKFLPKRPSFIKYLFQDPKSVSFITNFTIIYIRMGLARLPPPDAAKVNTKSEASHLILKRLLVSLSYIFQNYIRVRESLFVSLFRSFFSLWAESRSFSRTLFWYFWFLSCPRSRRHQRILKKNWYVFKVRGNY